jgi:hypothetical protein
MSFTERMQHVAPLEGWGDVAGGVEDNAYSIPCTPGEQVEYDQERLE